MADVSQISLILVIKKVCADAENLSKMFSKVFPEISKQFVVESRSLTISVALPSENVQMHFTLTVCFYHVTYAFQSESTLYICLNVRELLARNRRDI